MLYVMAPPSVFWNCTSTTMYVDTAPAILKQQSCLHFLARESWKYLPWKAKYNPARPFHRGWILVFGEANITKTVSIVYREFGHWRRAWLYELRYLVTRSIKKINHIVVFWSFTLRCRKPGGRHQEKARAPAAPSPSSGSKMFPKIKQNRQFFAFFYYPILISFLHLFLQVLLSFFWTFLAVCLNFVCIFTTSFCLIFRKFPRFLGRFSLQKYIFLHFSHFLLIFGPFILNFFLHFNDFAFLIFLKIFSPIFSYFLFIFFIFP